MQRKAFTLVELLIVIIIIAVLAAVVVPKFTNTTLRSKEATLRTDLRAMREAVDRFRSDTGVSPAVVGDLVTDVAPPKGKRKDGNDGNIAPGDFHGPYLQEIKNDPISGGAYNYSTSSPTVGHVKAPAGTASDGSDYATW